MDGSLSVQLECEDTLTSEEQRLGLFNDLSIALTLVFLPPTAGQSAAIQASDQSVEAAIRQCCEELLSSIVPLEASMGRFTEEQKQQKWREIEEELERIRKEKREQEDQRRQHEEEERKQKAKQRNLLWKEILLLFGSWHEAMLDDQNMTGISGIDGSWRNCWAISSQRIESLLSWMLRERRDAAYPQMLDRVWAGAKQATAKHVVL
ncbi:hypothetical protein AK812_SmicGene27650 [Symbiodinium microadriaticum]|uniref:Uncharacterized protein n=1 Tax=Symbiodinium microadriaticum TaxID=2951 RepID=A0A1Q9D6K4_SYMMI|nr:hypothetical protein AK812_SmicGene27650 [Symbiodinium microadriaticum]